MKPIEEARDKLSAYLFNLPELLDVAITKHRQKQVLMVQLLKDHVGIPRKFEGYQVIKQIMKRRK